MPELGRPIFDPDQLRNPSSGPHRPDRPCQEHSEITFNSLEIKKERPIATSANRPGSRLKDRSEYASKPKPLTRSPDTSVAEAVAAMSDKNYGSVIVVDMDDKVIGGGIAIYTIAMLIVMRVL